MQRDWSPREPHMWPHVGSCGPRVGQIYETQDIHMRLSDQPFTHFSHLLPDPLKKFQSANCTFATVRGTAQIAFGMHKVVVLHAQKSK